MSTLRVLARRTCRLAGRAAAAGPWNAAPAPAMGRRGWPAGAAAGGKAPHCTHTSKHKWSTRTPIPMHAQMQETAAYTLPYLILFSPIYLILSPRAAPWGGTG